QTMCSLEKLNIKLMEIFREDVVSCSLPKISNNSTFCGATRLSSERKMIL
ncbi:hypothetical protein L9F63_011944, partial [Diploptera punctata]